VRQYPDNYIALIQPRGIADAPSPENSPSFGRSAELISRKSASALRAGCVGERIIWGRAFPDEGVELIQIKGTGQITGL
jgi:hypothetical protein